jgi:hypothetical protein
LGPPQITAIKHRSRGRIVAVCATRFACGGKPDAILRILHCALRSFDCAIRMTVGDNPFLGEIEPSDAKSVSPRKTEFFPIGGKANREKRAKGGCVRRRFGHHSSEE